MPAVVIVTQLQMSQPLASPAGLLLSSRAGLLSLYIAIDLGLTKYVALPGVPGSTRIGS